MAAIGLKEEFEGALQRAGIKVPPDREQVMFEAFKGYRELASLLDEPLAYEAEPAAAYVVEMEDLAR